MIEIFFLGMSVEIQLLCLGPDSFQFGIYADL